jgi:hypothetical protein
MKLSSKWVPAALALIVGPASAVSISGGATDDSVV